MIISTSLFSRYFQGFDWAGIVKQTLTTPFRVKVSICVVKSCHYPNIITAIVHHNFVYGSYFMLINECFDEAKNKIEILWKNVTIQCSGTHTLSHTHKHTHFSYGK